MDFDILETLALKNGLWQNGPLHWQRLQQAALHFGYPLAPARLQHELQRFAHRHAQGDWRVRLALAAGGELELTAQPLLPTATPVRLAWAREPIANSVARSDWVRFKTSRRAHYEALQPGEAGVLDTILFNEDGEITEGTRGNIAMRIGGRWLTPPLSCGLLPGVGRRLALEQGRVAEGVVRRDEAQRVEAWAFVNSLRGWLPADLQT